MTSHWRFTSKDVKTILENYSMFSSGISLEPPKQGLENPEAQKAGYNNHTRYEKPCLLAAEIALRVKKCGLHGLLVEERYGMIPFSQPKTEDEISKTRHISLKDIYRAIHLVSWYCEGRNQRRTPYDTFKENPTKARETEKDGCPVQVPD